MTNETTQSTNLLDVVLLLALPASGKSEVRRYLASMTPQACQDEFGMGETVQLDDYPYVHVMRRIDEELERLKQPTTFFHSQQRPFKHKYDWGTLIELVNEDFADLQTRRVANTDSAAAHVVSRIDAARIAVGGTAVLAEVDPAAHKDLFSAIEEDCRALLDEKHAAYPENLNGKTVVIEFARGGPVGPMPLPDGHGYLYSLGRLSSEILSRASILYVWVTPEESRRKNEERAKPGRDGDASILHHGVPAEVMHNEYGCDDIEWLLERSGEENAIRIERDGQAHLLRLGRFDNRKDKTSFVRVDQAEWADADVKALHDGLKSAFRALAKG